MKIYGSLGEKNVGVVVVEEEKNKQAKRGANKPTQPRIAYLLGTLSTELVSHHDCLTYAI